MQGASTFDTIVQKKTGEMILQFSSMQKQFYNERFQLKPNQIL